MSVFTEVKYQYYLIITDVAVLGLHFAQTIGNELWFETDVRYISKITLQEIWVLKVYIYIATVFIKVRW